MYETDAWIFPVMAKQQDLEDNYAELNIKSP